MLVISDAKAEERELQELIESDPEIKEQHDCFVAEMEFKQKLMEIRKHEALTQKEVGRMSGLSQQAISRLERGKGATLDTVIRYLASMGYVLGVNKI